MIGGYFYMDFEVVCGIIWSVIEGNDFVVVLEYIVLFWSYYLLLDMGMSFGLGVCYVGVYYFDVVNLSDSNVVIFFDVVFSY